MARSLSQSLWARLRGSWPQELSRQAVVQRLGRGGFFRNVFVVMSGTAAAQVISFAFSPILSRLYDPAAFGLFGAYFSVAMVIGSATTLNYHDALMLPPKDEEAAPLMMVACLTTLMIALATALFAWAAPDPWLHALGIAQLKSFLWLLPVSVLLLGLSQTLTAWCARLKAFKATSQSQVLRSTTAVATQTGGGIAHLGGAGLIGASVVAEASIVAFLGQATLARGKAILRKCAHWSLLRRQAREYREFAIYGTPQHVMNALSQNLPVLALAHYYGAAVAGSYAFGIRLLQVPMNFVLTSIRQVLYQKLSQIHASGGPLHGAFFKSTAGLAALCLGPSALGFWLAPALFAFVFGAEWREAGEYARWLLFWFAPMFCNVPATLAARILRLQRDLFLMDVLLLGGRVAALVLGGLWLEPLQTIIVLSLVGAIFNVGFILYVGMRVRASQSIQA